MSNDLISRQVIINLIDAELAGELSPVFAEALNRARDLVSVEPAVTPQVVINVTGGVADVVAGTHPVEVNVLDYEIIDNEQDDYIVDDDGYQAWLYGEVANVDPAEVEKILNYPTVGEASE